MEKGQALGFPLRAENDTESILKKFQQGKAPDAAYLRKLGSVVPKHNGFTAGTNRRVLSAHDLKRTQGCYYSAALKQWIDDAVLMPKIKGCDWASLADDIRAGIVLLTPENRLTLCRSLSELVHLLESHGCAHRDLSSGNVFIDTNTWSVNLIDFDGLFHRSLQMPARTTPGTDGYIAGFVWNNGTANTRATWCSLADRLALAVLNTEFLIAEKESPLAADGGLFEQQELRSRSGKTLSLAHAKLQDVYPNAVPLFEAAIKSNCYEECPSPEEWMQVCLAATVQYTSIQAFGQVESGYFTKVLQQCRPATPIWPAPQLNDLPLQPCILPSEKKSTSSMLNSMKLLVPENIRSIASRSWLDSD